MKPAALLLLFVLPLAGCGGHEVDEDAWADDLAAEGYPDADVAKLRDLYTGDGGLCSKSVDSLALYVSLDASPDAIRTLEIGFKNACPDRADRLDEAIEDLESASDVADEACALPEAERNESQSDIAEALGC